VLQNETCYKAGRINTRNFTVVKGCSACFEAKVILGPDLSQGWTCLRAGLVSGQNLSKHFRARLVSGLDLSKNFGAGGVQKLQGRKCLAAGSVQKFRAGSVSRPEMSQSLGPEVSRDRTLGPDLSQGWTCPKTLGQEVSKSFRAGSVSRPDLVRGRKSLGAPYERLSLHLMTYSSYLLSANHGQVSSVVVLSIDPTRNKTQVHLYITELFCRNK
jgi:hypothetical protein